MERSPKRVHAGSGGGDGSDDDRISKLPDDLRLHILSFLSTKSAVKTGVLSKRWTRLWASSPHLRFDQNEFLNPGGADHQPPSSTVTATISIFVNFVDRALALRAQSGSIVRFELRWHRGLDIAKATTWLYYAMSHGVRYLVLSMPSSPAHRFVLPGALFRCPSLEYLLLKASGRLTSEQRLHPAYLPSPSSMSLSKLRQLRLVHILTPGSFLEGVISSCPGLEELLVAVTGDITLRASAPNLTRLTLLYHAATRQGSAIQITAPRLKHFVCHFWSLVPEISLGNLPLLGEARIRSSTIQDGNGAKLVHILESVCNAKVLFLKQEVVQSLSLVPDLSKHMSLSFPRLKYIEIEVLLNEDNIRSIMILLKSSTNLEKLVIHNSKNGEFRWNANGLEVGWFPQDLDGDCTLVHLMEIKIIGFFGVTDELDFVAHLLWHASALRYMILKYERQSWSPEVWTGISQDLQTIPRTSSTAEILLSTMD